MRMVGCDMRERDLPSSAHCFKSSSDFGLHTCHIKGLSISWNIAIATIIDQINHFGQKTRGDSRRLWRRGAAGISLKRGMAFGSPLSFWMRCSKRLRPMVIFVADATKY